MPFKKMRPFWAIGVLFGCVFMVLFSIRVGLFQKIFAEKAAIHLETEGGTDAPLPERDGWMNISQGGRKIGYSHSVLSKKGEGYKLRETVFMRINTLGMVQDMNLRTESILNSDLTLSSVDFEIRSSRFHFNVKGAVSGDRLSIETRSLGETRSMEIPLKEKPYVAAGVTEALRAAELRAGDKLDFAIFDPATMGQETIIAHVIGPDEILSMGAKTPATKVSMEFKGATQLAWIGENGDMLREEGLLGITLEKTSREDALMGPEIQPSQDITEIASVESNVRIDDPEALNTLVVEISGISLDGVQIRGERQTLAGNILTIRRESLSDIPTISDEEHLQALRKALLEPASSDLEDSRVTQRLQALEKAFLKPTPFIQSDHPKIRNLAESVMGSADTPLKKARKLFDWVHENIEKRPVLSLPDAISTLENRMGDCNEHAVLFAALARAAGIPARVEAGLVYLKGRFYYHAWNLLYLGKWITADALFGQMPADVTHIRFSTGGQQQQLDLMGIIGKIRLKIIIPST